MQDNQATEPNPQRNNEKTANTEKLVENPLLIKIPILFGTISQGMGKRGDYFFYKWIAFLKSYNNTDLSPIIDSVRFILHETYKNSIRSKLNRLSSASLLC